nr:hypothetical protein [Tanacetum cinerariifolium]
MQILFKLAKKARKPAKDSQDNDGDADDEDKDDDHVKMEKAKTVEHENKEKDEMTDAAKADDKRNAEEKGDAKLAGNAMIFDRQVKESSELPLPSSNSAEAKISSLMDIHIQQETLQIQSSSVLKLAPKTSRILSTIVDPAQESEKSALEIRKVKKELVEKQKMPKYTIKSTNKDENSMDKGVADTLKDHKRWLDDNEDDDEDPPAGPNSGKALSKSYKTSKSAIAKEPVEEPTAEVEMDDLVNTPAEDVVHNANQLHDDFTQAKNKAPKQDCIENLIEELLVGPVINLLKVTCKSSIELEYNMEECFKELTDRLDWNNPKRDRYPFDITKTLP